MTNENIAFIGHILIHHLRRINFLPKHQSAFGYVKNAESAIRCFKDDAKADCSPIPIAQENLKEVKCLSEAVSILTDKKQKEYPKRETDR